MKLPPLGYVRPKSVTSALDAWTDGNVMFLGGGQGLLSEMGLGMRRPATLVDLSALPDLTGVDVAADGRSVRVGAAVRLADLAAHPALRGSLLAVAARHVAVPPVRTLATVGGNFCHGNPTAELPLAALVAGATLVALTRDGREVRLDGPQLTGLRPTRDRSELLIIALEWPLPGPERAAGFEEVGEQQDWVPAVALGWLTGQPSNGSAPHPTRVGVALRDGGQFLLSLDDDGTSCSVDLLRQAAEAAAVETDLPMDWLSDLINDRLGAAAPERM